MSPHPIDADTRRFLLRIGARIPGAAPQPCHGYQFGCICPKHDKPLTAVPAPAQPWEPRVRAA